MVDLNNHMCFLYNLAIDCNVFEMYKDVVLKSVNRCFIHCFITRLTSKDLGIWMRSQATIILVKILHIFDMYH